jgi:hypothetical protein
MGIILAYVVLNSLFIGLALVLARGLSWQATGVLNPENLLPDFIMLSLGYAVALLWSLNPWLVLPVPPFFICLYSAQGGKGSSPSFG